MDDLELIRSFRAQVPLTEAPTRDRARVLLEEHIAASAVAPPVPSRAPSQRPRRLWRLSRRGWTIALAAALLAALFAAPGLGLGGRLVDLFGLSGGERVPVQWLSPEDRWLLRRGGGFGFRSMDFLGGGGPIAYYAITRKDGSNCFATGLLRNRPHISSLDCPSTGKALAFPSAKAPLLDRSAFSAGRQTARWIFVLTGLAADGIARVGVIDESGTLHPTPVVDHVYYTTKLPNGLLRAMVALDPNGRTVYRLALSPATHRAAKRVRALGEAGAVLIRFMAARIQRDDQTFTDLMTPALRRAVETGSLDVPTWQVSNPCWYRYTLLPPRQLTDSKVVEDVRIYQHWWPVAGGPPHSFRQEVRMLKDDGRWLVDGLGPAIDTKTEPAEPHGPHTSACALAQN
jgi:hypothetical protein